MDLRKVKKGMILTLKLAISNRLVNGKIIKVINSNGKRWADVVWDDDHEETRELISDPNISWDLALFNEDFDKLLK